MPSLTFVLPHWLYWGGLIAFPLIAQYLVRRQRRDGVPRQASVFIAYLFWLCSGFLGIHRLYLRSNWGFVFIPVFLVIIYCNGQIREAREDVSRTRFEFENAELAIERARPPADETVTAEAKAALEAAEAEGVAAKPAYDSAQAELAEWRAVSRWSAILMAIMLLVDAALLPGVIRRVRAQELSKPYREAAVAPPPAFREAGTGEDPTLSVHSRITDAIEWLTMRAGEFGAYWAVIAVFVYYYEVIGRYVFNSPTIWAHESMFLMFGMQYMLSGAYAYREDQHVRVDIFYAKFSARGKAIADIVTSVFFFIFIGTMFWTGMRFALDGIEVQELSFTEWAIQYWPVKLMIPVGAALLLLQGVSKLIKDVLIVTRREA